MRTDHQIVPVCKIQFLIGIDNSLAWRRAKAGRYGTVEKIQCPDGRYRQCVSLERVQVEEARTFSEEEIEHALNTPSTPKRKADRDSAKARHVDFGLQQMIATLRDIQILDALREQHVDLTNFQFPPYLEKPVSLDSQELFTRGQVRELIDNALNDRDSEWHSWLRDPVARAEHRSGPPKQWSGK